MIGFCEFDCVDIVWYGVCGEDIYVVFVCWGDDCWCFDEGYEFYVGIFGKGYLVGGLSCGGIIFFRLNFLWVKLNVVVLVLGEDVERIVEDGSSYCLLEDFCVIILVGGFCGVWGCWGWGSIIFFVEFEF